MTTQAIIKDESLVDYANVLYDNGFSIYVAPGVHNFFVYSREVDGKECFGSVQYDSFEGYRHFMPIKPSTEHGSGMFVEDGTNNVVSGRSLDAARFVASSKNYNHLVGSQENYVDTNHYSHYIKW